MWLLSKNAGFCCLFGAQVSAAYALTEGDASGPAQTLLAADTESDSDPDSGIATLPEGGYTAFQEQDIFYNQNYNAIAKTGKKLDNALNQVQYQIVVNPDGVTFQDGKERLKLVDTLTNHAVLSGTSSQGTSSGSDNRNLLQTGVAYRMVELEAPHGYELRMEPFDFYIDTEPANTPKDYAGQRCFSGQRVFIPNTTWLEYADPTGSSTTGEEETRTAAAPMPDNHKNKVMGAVDSLIQTGQLNWPIPVLLTLGGALVLAGLVLTRRKNRR